MEIFCFHFSHLLLLFYFKEPLISLYILSYQISDEIAKKKDAGYASGLT